jgi:flavodoxin
MSKTAIVYATKTKHSKKLASAIGNALHVQPQNVTQKPVLKDVDLLFIVGGIYGGQSLPVLLDYISSLDANEIKNAVLITSCTSKTSRQDAVRSILSEKGIQVLDEFISPGSFLFMQFGHPNKEDLRNAADFASALVKKLEG